MNARLARIWVKMRLDSAPRARKIAVAILGGTVLLLGICLIVLPGPAVLVIPAGLAILATEFIWARRWLQKVRGLAGKARNAFRP